MIHHTVGIDISKAHLHAFAAPEGRAARFSNDTAGFRKLAARAEDYVHGSAMLEMLNPTTLGIVCFRITPTEVDLGEPALDEINREVLASIFWGGRAFISSTLLHGTFSLRLCILNHTTTWDDVRETLEAIERSGKAVVEEHRAKP